MRAYSAAASFAVASLILACYSPMRAMYGLPKLMCLALGMTAAWAALAKEAWDGRLRLRASPIDAPLALFVIFAAASVARSPNVFGSLMGFYNEYFTGAVTLGLCVALYYAVWLGGDGDNLVRVILFAGTVCAAYGILQWLDIVHVQLPADRRIISTLGSPILLGGVLTAMIPPAFSYALSRSGKDFYLGAACLAASAVALVLTLSRGSCFCAFAGAGSYLLLSGRVKLEKKYLFPAVVSAGALIFILLLMGSLRSTAAASDAERGQLWLTGLGVFAEHPWFGVGLENFEPAFRLHKTLVLLHLVKRTSAFASSAHNDFIQALATMGLTGFLPYLALLIATAKGISRRLAAASAREDAAAAAGALAGLFLLAKLNPLPLAAVGLAAVFAALALRRPDKVASKIGRGISATACVLVLAALCATTSFVARQYRADALFSRAFVLMNSGYPQMAVDDFRAAVKEAPRQVFYTVELNKCLHALAAKAENPRKAELLAEAVEAGRRVALALPGEERAVEAYGTALSWSKEGGLDLSEQAAQTLDRAQHLDPTYLPVLRARALLARASGDEAKFQALYAEFGPIYALIRNEDGSIIGW
jgi:O-antigen ligase